MHRLTQSAGVFVTVAALGSSVVVAGPPGTEFTYQGFLEVSGTPANGDYDFELRLVDTSTGGVMTSASTHTNIPVVDGEFTIPDVDWGEDYDVAAKDAVLRIRVQESGGAGFTTLAPDQPFTATPLAGQLRGVGLATNSFGTQQRTFGDDGERKTVWGTSAGDGTGFFNALTMGLVDTVITASLDGDDDGAADGKATGALELRSVGGANGGRIKVRDDSGTLTVDIRGGESRPSLTLTGPGSAAVIDLSLSGDGSVQLPNDAISSIEMLDEPGVASDKNTGLAVTLSVEDAIYVPESAVIDCPADGYCLVIGTCQVTVPHVNGTGDRLTFGVSDDGAAFPPNQDVSVRIPSNAAEGSWDYAVTVHGLFEVSAGSNAFFLLATREYGVVSEVFDTQLSIVYIPTAYGTVDPTFAGDGSWPDSAGISSPPQTWRTLEAELRQSLAANLARRDSELEQMRREVAELRAMLDDRGQDDSDEQAAALTQDGGVE
jgi:hypothetical protein